MRRLTAILIVVFLGFTGLAPLPLAPLFAAYAQETDAPPDYAAWQKFSNSAEPQLDQTDITIPDLEALRVDLVTWRSRFSKAQDANANRISILKNQIDALGPAPQDGATEPEDIAGRRKVLNDQLMQLEAPRLKADEAFRHADGLIGEIDTILRDRQTRQFLTLGPTPLNPVHWTQAARDLRQSVSDIWQQFDTAWNVPERRADLRNNLLVIGLEVLIALVLLGRGRAWMERLTRYVQNSPKATKLRGLGVFLISLGQVILPFFGILLLVSALEASQLFGQSGLAVITRLPGLALSFVAARWLTLRLFPDDSTQAGLLDLDIQTRAEMRFYGSVLGLLFGVTVVLSGLADVEDYSEATRAVLIFPLILVSGLILFRLGAVLRRSQTMTKTNDAGESVGDLRGRLGVLTGGALVAAGIGGPLIGAAGYNNAAALLVFPMVLSIGLIGLLLVLQRVITDAYAMMTGKSPEESDQALAPVLIGFLLVVLSLPVFALFWGARVTDLTELWTKFQQGFTLAGITISPAVFMTFAIVFAIGYAITRFLQTVLRTSVLPKTKLDTGGRTAILSGIGYVGIFLAALVAITSAGIDLSSLAIVAGALSVGIGFGLQNIVSNFVSGIILLIERPIAEGDWIEVAGQSGYVRDISVRSTRIETFDRTDVIVPNADLVSGVVTNWTRGNLIGRVKVGVGVAYGTDTRRVEKILREIAEDHPLVAMKPPPAIFFMAFGADSLDFEIRAILRDVNFIMSVHSDMNHAIAKRFAEEGIEIPFAQRDVWLRNPEALRMQATDPDKTDDLTQSDPALPDASDEAEAAR